MKKTFTISMFVIFAVLNAVAFVLKSPDQKLLVETSRNATIEIEYNGTKIMDINGVGMIVDGKKLTPNLNKVVRQKQIIEDYIMVSGKKKKCQTEFNEYVFSMGRNGEMYFRISNDGIALRYALNQTEAKITDDLTTFCWGLTPCRWLQKYTENYEDFYNKFNSDLQQGEWGYPALVEIDEDKYILVSEANIKHNNAASRLNNLQEKTSYKVTLADSCLTVNAKWTSPWRVAIVGDLSQIVESTLITDLSEPTQIDNTDWIEPGIVSWVYWAYNHGSNDYQIVKKYIDMAKMLHLPYVLIDAEWDEMTNGGNIEDAVAYSLSQGIKPLIWYNSSTSWLKKDGAPGPHNRLNNASDREREFEKISEWGVAGVKIDFFEGDHLSTMDYCIDLLESAARHKLLVNFHGATIPRGWQRTYPNLMSVEAVYGAEWYNNLPDLTNRAAQHNTTLPFTRNVIGSMDYTPCAFSDSQHPHITTKGHELALTVVYESALQHLADCPESLKNQPMEVQDFFGHLPSTWDETRLLGGYPGQWVALARRKGEYWYLGVLNGADTDKIIDVDWKRIIDPSSSYQHVIYADHSIHTNQWHIISTFDLLPQTIKIAPRGGQVIIVKR